MSYSYNLWLCYFCRNSKQPFKILGMVKNEHEFQNTFEIHCCKDCFIDKDIFMLLYKTLRGNFGFDSAYFINA